MKTKIGQWIYLGLSTLLLYACHNNKESMTTAQLLDSILQLHIKIDSLQKTNIEGGNEMDYWRQPGTNHRLLKQMGIREPKLFLLQSLESRKDLIPLKPTLGGAFIFNRISLLGDSWAIASYEDGHIGGLLLLSYKVVDNEVKWNRLDNHSQD